MDIVFTCKHCGQQLEIDEHGAGVSIDCPKCGKAVYVPSRSTVAAQQPPKRVTVNPSRKPNSLPPAIEGGLHCVVIAVVLFVVGLMLFRMGHVANTICYALGIPFQIGALLCGVYGICKGSIKHSLALLAGVGVLSALIMIGPLWIVGKIYTFGAPMTDEWMRQMQPIIKQYQR